ncbi:MAG: 1-deoxy-D-xylulose-5-phosphate reductoisomerase [Clostridiales bacterium]|jgi:1-deoxy-D-xylulose-5-phosphate reductoisomerase|nr:1-deoxy-D-xylulose-5-phosphate reductoisomerase [Clostridiales bacterium]
MIKTLSVLGSTGSIGRQTIEVARHLGLAVTELTSYTNYRLLENQCREFKVRKAWIGEQYYSDLKILLADTGIKVFTGEDALYKLAYETQADIVCNSLLGISGLKPTLAALKGGHNIALSNKEALVEGGSLVTGLAKEKNLKIIPVDSEHSAIFQCQNGKTPKKIFLTASGGAFYGRDRNFLKTVTPEMATKHPNWNMGAKITVDSATLMNKGLEIIEAVYLFDVNPDQIEVIIHRESVIHSMVEFSDNSVIAQLSNPDMRLCIQYALTYPERLPSLTKPLDFTKLSSLSFSKPDEETFTLLKLAKRCINKGGNCPAAMSSANEEAVALFLNNKISFLDIFDYVERAVSDTPFIKNPTLEQILSTDTSARETVRRLAGRS